MLTVGLVFSFIFLILGFLKESSPLALIGSLSLMIVSISLLVTGVQATDFTIISNETLNYTAVETTYSFGEESTLPTGMLLTIFSIMTLLYSGKLILYGAGT